MSIPPPEAAHWSRRPSEPARGPRWGIRAVIISAVAVVSVAVVTAGVAEIATPQGIARRLEVTGTPSIGTFSHHPVHITLPAHPVSYVGFFAKAAPPDYAPIKFLANVSGVHPNIALYYSGWYEQFQSKFATQAKDNGAVSFVQIEPSGVRFAAIVAGEYDTYLKTFATNVAAYGAKTGQGVIIGFGHEMNGRWYSWGYRHISPAVFVAAWRHIVNVFRQQGAYNVTWLWTVNIIDLRGGIPSPTPWWPGSSYVTWVGIDGYYLKSSWRFASLFGPTIKAVRALTLDPILIAETGAVRAPSQPAKIDDLFAGVHAYGLLGFVWFDANGIRDWRLSSPAAFAAFRRGAQALRRPVP